MKYIAKTIYGEYITSQLKGYFNPDTTIYKDYAMLFANKKDAYRYAWRYLKLHKYEIILERI